MVIIGAGGLGIDILGMLLYNAYKNEIIFYDDTKEPGSLIFDLYKIISNMETLKKYFEDIDSDFIIGNGVPRLREKLNNKMTNIGGKYVSVISDRSTLFPFHPVYSGMIAYPGSGISHGCDIGISALLNGNSTIGHRVKMGRYVNIGPNASIIGPVEIGDFTSIGAGAIVLPNIKVGKNVIVGAGTVVDLDVPDFATVVNERVKKV